MNIKLSLAALAITALPLVAGCAADTSDVPGEETEATEDELVKSRIAEGTFKLYADADAVPSRHCDVYTKLELVNDRGAKAKLSEDLGEGSLCRIAIFPNEREFRLRQTGTECGSKIYEGAHRVALGPATTGLAKIKITDHRTRMCRDLVPAQIIVEESGQPTKYSYDGAPRISGQFPAGDKNSLSGKLFAAMKAHAETANSETAKYIQAVGGSTVTFEKDGDLAQCSGAVLMGGVQYTCHFDVQPGGFEWTNSSDSVQAELHEALRVATNGGAVAELKDTLGNGVSCEGRTLGMIQVMSYRCDVSFQK
jgi:hypothetical protein